MPHPPFLLIHAFAGQLLDSYVSEMYFGTMAKESDVPFCVF